MELLQLRYFCDAAETQNFSKTAKKHLVPTSNISQSIKRLETELETQLFTRCANKIVLNETGSKFYKSVKQALELLNDAQKEATGTQLPETIKINIHITRRIVMDTIEIFQKQYPDISFIITHTADSDLNSYDIVITDKDFETSLVKKEIARENLLLAYNQESFCFNGRPTVQQLANCPFITMSSGSSINDYTQEICHDLGFAPRIVLQSEDPFYIRKCIELGLGIAIVPELSWHGLFSDCVNLQSIGNYIRRIYIYHKHSTNAYFQKFYDALLTSFHT